MCYAINTNNLIFLLYLHKFINMKNVFKYFLVLFFPILHFSQCNPSDKYDKIISAYHQSVALKSNGAYAAWGEAVSSTGGDVLSPQEINSTNYTVLGSDTPLKATIGGDSNSQTIILTNNGLYTMGESSGVLLSTTIKNTAAFSKITYNIGNSETTTKLPTGILPTDVQMMVASYQTLIILAKGNVFVLTQANAALQGNGSALSGTSWSTVKTGSSTVLSNIIQVRAQVSSSSIGAIMALSSNGKVYTWGPTTYLGDTSSAISRNYASEMTLPSEFSSSNVPKMIGVTGGDITNTKNSYFLLSNSGSLYALGYNNNRQLGDFSTTERKSWVNVQKTAGVNFTDVEFISAQEHSANYPAAALITKTGVLYSWGTNNGFMIGRPSDTTNYDPGIPNGFTQGVDKAITTEMGGHTLVYLKEGSDKFCYVGHRVQGSMGDGTNTSTNESTFNCSATPTLSICGSVPIVASPVTSEISVNQPIVAANGTSTSIITIRLKDSLGNYLTTSGGVVTVFTDLGTLGTVVDNNNGTYTVILTSSTNAGTATITYAINGTTSNNSTSVNMVAAGSLSTDVSAKNDVVVYPNPFNTEFVVKGITGVESVKIFDANGKFIVQKSVKNNDKINLQHLPKGTYFVKIGAKTIKLIKQ